MDEGKKVFREIKRLASKIANSGAIILIDDKGKKIYECFLGDKKQSVMRVDAYLSSKVDVRSLVGVWDVELN